jgi:large subunit ribosomal protein L2
MPIKKYKPTTNARRQMSVNTYEELTTDTPYKPLLTPRVSHSGRNNSGRITVRHQGGGNKRAFRLVDFYFVDKLDVPARVETVEYDPNRSAYISLICYRDGERRYIVAHKDIKVGDEIVTSKNAKPIPGNRLSIGNIPTGLNVFNVELIVGQGASSIRSAGSFATIVSQDGEYTQIRMPSGEVRKVHKECYATIGVISNIDHNQVVIGKAGRSRNMGIRPTVLGKSMNPVDHPHGG